MKQLWKTAVLTLLGTVFAVCLGMGVSAANRTIQNGIGESFTWETDLETGTLTITGEGYIPQTGNEDGEVYHFPWAEDEDKIKTLILKGKDIYFAWFDYTKYYSQFLQKIVGEVGDGFSWTIDIATQTTTINGNGPWPKDVTYMMFDSVVIAEGITDFWAMESPYCYAGHSLRPTSDWLNIVYQVGPTANIINPQRGEFHVDPKNPYCASYDGCLYTKDYSKLLMVPRGKSTMTFHPDLKILGANCMSEDMTQDPLILPWGVTTVEEQAFCFYNDSHPTTCVQVILPDTLTDFALTGNYYYRNKRRSYIFSKNNAALKSLLYTTEISDMGGYVEAIAVDSLAQYYPDVPEAQGTAPSDKPGGTESSTPESSKPAESSAPASQLESSAPASQPASKPSQPPESKPTSESSAPAQSSGSASSSLVSIEESSIAESSQEESAAESPDESSKSTESEETSQPEGLPTVERKAGGAALMILAVILAAASGAGIVLLMQKKRK